MRIRFLGGAETVTGSKHLVETGKAKILIDCGLFQGAKSLRDMNWASLPVDPQTIDAVVLTHAHIDHCGYLPLLVKQGFRGPIFATEPTLELVKLLLLDAAKLQEEDAQHANAHGYSRHKPALPLYTTRDAQEVFPLLQPVPVHSWTWIHPEVQVRLRWNGHILGSAFVELRSAPRENGVSTMILFSGDVGRAKPLTLNPPEEINSEADYIVTESTYGDRKHPKEDPFARFEKIVNETIQRGGQVLVPVFAVGRAQDVLHILASLKRENRIPDVPIYIDSPMAVAATKLFDRFSHYHKLVPSEVERLSTVGTAIESQEQSQKLIESDSPCVILAGSGMINGGRIKRHLAAKIADEKNTVAIVGFQAAGTLGRFLYEGADEVKIYGEFHSVNATIEKVMSLSAHADQVELLEWLGKLTVCPQRVFIVHGEQQAAEGLRVRITDLFGCKVQVAKLNEVTDELV